MQRWRVPLGFACAAPFFLLAQPRPLTLSLGALVALPGLALRAWAVGHLRKNEALATDGPYAHTRNPLYLGSFLIGLGFTIAAGRLILGALFALLFLGIYVPVMRVEARTLAELFGEHYRQYAKSVPLLWPRLSPYRDPASERKTFDAGLYSRYREYRALLGLIVAWALLVLRSFLIKWN
jgi:protein-S-isoprenylcysteine O-methyltransferase Ste14